MVIRKKNVFNNPPTKELITLTAIFTSTGDRVPVRLPLDIRGDLAARLIFERVFLRNVSEDRLYIFKDSEFNLLKKKQIIANITLREAGLKEGDEVRIELKSESIIAFETETQRTTGNQSPAVKTERGNVNITFGTRVGSFPFDVISHYDPSGFMGDIGDIDIVKTEDSIQFSYDPRGRGPHEWEYKFTCGIESDIPAKFGGVMLLNPPNNWGDVPDGGYDLRGANVITWKARSLSNYPVYVEFLIGGIKWHWDINTKKKIASEFSDSLSRISLGTRKLSTNLQTFEVDFRDNVDQSHLRQVIGGFGWIILKKQEYGPFSIEVKDIQYKNRREHE